VTESLADARPVNARGKSKEKHARILDASMNVFLERGFEGASVDHIAAEANVSKQTIYNHFGDKASLFRAVCRRLSDDLARSIAQAPNAREDVKAALMRMGRVYLDLVLAPGALALHRIIIGEIGRFPELGRTIYADGAARFLGALAEWLRERDRAGELRVEDAAAAAEDFIALVRGNRQIRALLGVEETRGLARAQAVRRAVDLFLRAHAP
jgi:AcrR family transcriptional regulator